VTAILEVTNLTASYGDVQVLHGLDFTIEQGSIATILGANGAGKTTTMRALTSAVSVQGSIRFKGQQIAGLKTDAIARLGVALVPQGRGTFNELTVRENMQIGAITRKDQPRQVAEDIDRIDLWFPRLKERSDQYAGNLSGGEQQMLAVARALLLRPSLLLLDEPSLGLSPIATQELFKQLGQIHAELGTTMLIVEQNAGIVLNISHHALVLETGRIVAEGSPAQIAGNESVRRAYLGY
jgi:branched-chain amino acid transport system ATP-binding protein